MHYSLSCAQSMALKMRAGNLAVTAVSVLGRRASAYVGSHARLPSRKLHGRLEIVKAPIHLGQLRPGVETAPDRILDDQHFMTAINDGYGGRRWPSIHIRDIDIGTGTESQHMSSSANETVFQGYDNALLDRSCMNDSSLAAAPCVVIGARKGAALRNAVEVGGACRALHDATRTCAESGAFVLTLGGDHSMSIGSIAGVQQHYGNLGVIWVDAHADLNTPDTTYSGNLHGCTAGFLFGLHNCYDIGPMRWLKQCRLSPILRPASLVYIGLCELDPAERHLAKELGVLAFSMLEVEQRGHWTLRHLESSNPGCPYHLSFDIDSFDKSVAPSTGFPSPAGLNEREGKFICHRLAESGRLVSMDLVEVNPQIGSSADAEKTLRLARSVMLSALGDHYLQVPAGYAPNQGQ